jgi:hypothetical protein
VLAAFFAYGARCDAADLYSPIPPAPAPSAPAPRPNSILVFGGRMSTTDIFSTLLFDLNENVSGTKFDNFILGTAYDRDLFDLGHGFYFGVEVGIADRFGNYSQCCNPIVLSSSVVQSAEFWTGPQFRYAGILLFDAVRIGGAVTFGLSAATASIGREAQLEIQDSGNARLAYYLGPENRHLDAEHPELRIGSEVAASFGRQ